MRDASDCTLQASSFSRLLRRRVDLLRITSFCVSSTPLQIPPELLSLGVPSRYRYLGAKHVKLSTTSPFGVVKNQHNLLWNEARRTPFFYYNLPSRECISLQQILYFLRSGYSTPNRRFLSINSSITQYVLFFIKMILKVCCGLYMLIIIFKMCWTIQHMLLRPPRNK